MARQVHRLTARKVSALAVKGLHPDGAGVYLQVAAGGAKSWIYRFKAGGKTRDMGLGSARSVSLADARARAAEARRQRAAGLDPIAIRKEARSPKSGGGVTFDDACVAFIAAHEPSWKSAKHRAQWRSTLAIHASPRIGRLSVEDIDTEAVLAILEPIWMRTPETATRLRGRIESVLDWAKARGLRSGENPARWRGHLQSLLPPRSKIQAVRHHPALPVEALAKFMAALRANASVSALALEFLILTASRTGETLGARWGEIDLAGRVWTIAGPRMKGGRLHRVPLARRAKAILSEMDAMRVNDFVFPGSRRDKPLSSMALLMLMRRIGYGEFTVHGFRSSFRDWVAENTDAPREVAEAALAHAVGDRVEAAYRRGDLFAKRRELMDAWEVECRPGEFKKRRR